MHIFRSANIFNLLGFAWVYCHVSFHTREALFTLRFIGLGVTQANKSLSLIFGFVEVFNSFSKNIVEVEDVTKTTLFLNLLLYCLDLVRNSIMNEYLFLKTNLKIKDSIFYETFEAYLDVF